MVGANRLYELLNGLRSQLGEIDSNSARIASRYEVEWPFNRQAWVVPRIINIIRPFLGCMMFFYFEEEFI